MDNINNYIDGVFSGLPKTPNLQNIKEEMKVNMITHYKELLNSGVESSEAFNIVILKYGNLNDIYEQLNSANNPRELDIIDIENILKSIEKYSKYLTFSLILFFLAPCVFIILNNNFPHELSIFNFQLSIVIISLLYLISIILILIKSLNLYEYDFLDIDVFELTNSAKEYVLTEFNKYRLIHSKKVSISLFFIFSSLVSLLLIFMFSNSTQSALIKGILIFFLFLSCSVYFLSQTTQKIHIYEKLLQIESYTSNCKIYKKKISSIKLIFSITTIAIYVVWTIFFNGYLFSWISFPLSIFIFYTITKFIKYKYNYFTNGVSTM